MNSASLVLVGSGIKALSHLSKEANTYIQHADKVLYLTNEPVTEEWILKNSKEAESLDEIYFHHPKRHDSYKAITEHILQNLRLTKHICVVMYGHPCFYAKSGMEAVIQAQAEGYEAFILPAISTEDCLFADLQIDPATYGCQSYDATDFLIHQNEFSTNAHLLLFQVNSIGSMGQAEFHENASNLKILVNYLIKFYPTDHSVLLYSAAQYPGMKSKVRTFELQNLIKTKISNTETLYIPPMQKRKANLEMLRVLSIQ